LRCIVLNAERLRQKLYFVKATTNHGNPSSPGCRCHLPHAIAENLVPEMRVPSSNPKQFLKTLKKSFAVKNCRNVRILDGEKM
jgi:hypothetical protein